MSKGPPANLAGVWAPRLQLLHAPLPCLPLEVTTGQHGTGWGGYPAPFLWVVTGQLLGLQVRELLWLVRGGKLIFRLRLDNHLQREMTQKTLNGQD